MVIARPSRSFGSNGLEKGIGKAKIQRFLHAPCPGNDRCGRSTCSLNTSCRVSSSVRGCRDHGEGFFSTMTPRCPRNRPSARPCTQLPNGRRYGKVVDRTGGKPQRLLKLHVRLPDPRSRHHVVEHADSSRSTPARSRRGSRCRAPRSRSLSTSRRRVPADIGCSARPMHPWRTAPERSSYRRDLRSRRKNTEGIRFENILHRSPRKYSGLRPESSGAVRQVLINSAPATTGRLISRSRCRRNALRAAGRGAGEAPCFWPRPRSR